MKKYVKPMLAVGAVIIVMFALTACFPGDGTNSAVKEAGFFSGIWHGWIAPISLIGSIFNSNLSIYEVHNNGFLYNIGYYMAVISGFGGLNLARKKSLVHIKYKRSNNNDDN